MLEWAWNSLIHAVSIGRNVDITIHVEFYKFLRILLQQSLTRSLLAQVLLPQDDRVLSQSSERGLLRMYAVWLDCTCIASYDLRPILAPISAFCRRIAKDTQKNASLRSLAHHCYSAACTNMDNYKHLFLSKKPLHVFHSPLYAVLPFKSEEMKAFMMQLRNVDDKASDLYQYTFTAESMNHCDFSNSGGIEVFKKKNIQFRGSIHHRDLSILNEVKRDDCSYSSTLSEPRSTIERMELDTQMQESTKTLLRNREEMHPRSTSSLKGVGKCEDDTSATSSQFMLDIPTKPHKKKENCCTQ